MDYINQKIPYILLLLISCQHKPDNLAKGYPLVTDSGSIKKESAVSIDSSDRAYYEDRLFYPTIIRLYKNERAFIFTDSVYIETADLDSTNREQYYDKVRPLISKDERKVHEIAWSIDEVKEQQSGDGGLYTVCTWIVERPDQTNHFFYTVDIKRNYVDRLGTVMPIKALKINLKTKEILVADMDWTFHPLKKWRKLKNDEK